MKALISLAMITLALPVSAIPNPPEKDVVYVEEFAPDGIKLKVEKPGYVFATKKGGRKYGALRVNQYVELVSFSDKAYYVRGKRENGEGVSGWVTPAAFSSKEPKFVEKLKQVYTRQLTVRQLIADKEVALGMTPEEVSLVLGEPTKTNLRRTSKGQTQVWEFIEYREEKHYITRRDPYTGGIFRQYSHSTREEISKTVVEFENGFVSATEQSQDHGRKRPKIVTAPIIFYW